MHTKALFSSLLLGLLATCGNARVIASQSPAVLAACPAGDATIIRRELISGLNEETGLMMTQVQCVDDSTTTSALDEKHPSQLMERQFEEICTQTCVQSCHVFGTIGNVPNCTGLINELAQLDGQTFIAAPSVTTLFESGTCTTRFFHGESQPISVCFSWMNGLLPTMNECFQTAPQNGAECNQGGADFSFDLTMFFTGAIN